MDRTALGRWLPAASLTLAMILWGSSFIALKIAFAGLPPFFVMFARMAVATAFLACFYTRFRNVRYHKGDWKLILLMAGFEPCLYFVFEATALLNTSASQAGMVMATLPLIAAVAARLILKERLHGRGLAGFAVAIGGVVALTVSGSPSEHAPHPVLGNFLEFLAICCASGYFIVLKRLLDRYNPWFLTSMQAVVGMVFFAPALLLPSGRPGPDVGAAPILATVYLGLAVTLGAYGCYNYGVSRIPVSRASAYINLIPVITLVMAWLFLGERLSLAEYLASGIVVAGVALSQTGNRQEA
ncbi:DMT family transporter [Fundidesulfovibrio soli]|uniref:DMT family transporter n=1 Tax=Fundidesulfovibrio soli TaxID=2922716 RepID=UPI001FB0147C|nr:DMT family transporter [Fundidesulfovibrio soli]